MGFPYRHARFHFHYIASPTETPLVDRVSHAQWKNLCMASNLTDRHLRRPYLHDPREICRNFPFFFLK